MTQSTTTALNHQTLTTTTTMQILGALGFGLALLFVVGFSSMNVAHNAAHDTRHAFAFPCH